MTRHAGSGARRLAVCHVQQGSHRQLQWQGSSWRRQHPQAQPPRPGEGHQPPRRRTRCAQCLRRSTLRCCHRQRRHDHPQARSSQSTIRHNRLCSHRSRQLCRRHHSRLPPAVQRGDNVGPRIGCQTNTTMHADDSTAAGVSGISRARGHHNRMQVGGRSPWATVVAQAIACASAFSSTRAVLTAAERLCTWRLPLQPELQLRS